MKKYPLLLLLIALVIVQNVNAQTPVAYYPFSGNANDAAGTNNGTVNGTTLTTDRFGNTNNAYSFNGTTADISLGAFVNFQNFTIAMWLKPGSTQVQFANIIDNNHSTIRNWVCQQVSNSTNLYDFSIPGVGGIQFSLAANVWQQLVLVKSATTMQAYINGSLVQSSAVTGTINYESPLLKLGSFVAGGGRNWNGNMDEIKIYNTALTAIQVQNEYLSANNYGSQFANSVKMNGANDQIELGSTYTQQIFTVEMWVKPGATQVQYANIIDNNHTNTINWVCQQNASNTNLYGFGVNTNGVSNGVEFQLQPNVWQHIALIKDATAVQVYVNGVLIQSNPISGSINFSGQFLRLGNWGGGGRNWNGTMDEVRYWSTARTQAEIVANMNTQITGSEAGLVGYWDMNRNGQGAGLTVDNKCVATGVALNGTTVGTANTPIFEPAVTQQKPGSGNTISFDGVDDVIDIPSSTANNFSLNQNFTIECWAKVPSSIQPNEATESANSLVEKWDGVTGGYPYVIRYRNNNPANVASVRNKIEVARWNGTNYIPFHSSVSVNDDKFHHISATKNGSLLSLYIDGVLQNTATDLSSGQTDNPDPLHIGGRTSANPLPFNGIVDEIRIWNTALTQAQIRDRMCRKITSSDALYSNLVAYYNFDESIGNTAFDGTANNNNGTLTNSPTRVTSGAPIGNFSNSFYQNGNLVHSFTNPLRGDMLLVGETGFPNPSTHGIHIYCVTESPNTTSGATGVGSNNSYFGVFRANVNEAATAYTAVYNYQGINGISNEDNLRLYKRDDNATALWTDANAVLNTTANTLTASGQHTEYIVGSIGFPLPLNLITFSGSKQNTNAQLQWRTANEVNISRFELQRSENGQAFTSIATIVGGGINYKYTDDAIFNTKEIVFYRLKIIDKDGAFKFSNVIKLTQQEIDLLTIYPNPAIDVVTISGLKQGGILYLFNAEGKLLQQQKVTNHTTRLRIGNYNKGIYLLQYKNENEAITQKIIKQ